MTIAHCKVCNDRFYARPAHVKNGWGVFCSRNCKHIGSRIRIKLACFTCGREIYKTASQMGHSKSTKYFCDKSCQTKWRNAEFSGAKHANYKNGEHSYSTILGRLRVKKECWLCRTKDVRVLVTHHIDENHKNNEIKNLAWLCHNCHCLVHYDNVERQKFLRKHVQKL